MRRPVRAQARATLAPNDEEESQGMLRRFAEIRDGSLPVVTATAIGL
ncbi:MAG: hypothetical protein AAB654_19015 [Acidobacteriota bacterium]